MEVTTQLYTMLYEPLTKAFVEKPMLVMPHVTCTSPWPIEIEETFIELVIQIDKLFFIYFKSTNFNI